MKKSLKLAAVLGTVGLAVAACGSKPVTSGGSSTTSANASAFKACLVTDTGGLDDHSFNELSWEGMQDRAEGRQRLDHGAERPVDDLQRLRRQHRRLRLGRLQAHRRRGLRPADRPGAVLREEHQPALRGGGQHLRRRPGRGPAVRHRPGGLPRRLLRGRDTPRPARWPPSAAPTTRPSRSTWTASGRACSTTTSSTTRKVQVLGWSETTQKGTFDPTQSFTDQAGGQQIAENFEAQGADIVFPVAGGTGIGALAAAQASGGKLKAIWVDNDGYYSNPQYQDIILTSVTKGINAAVATEVEQAAKGNFTTTSYIGTLANGGTTLAPFHAFASDVPRRCRPSWRRSSRDHQRHHQDHLAEPADHGEVDRRGSPERQLTRGTGAGRGRSSTRARPLPRTSSDSRVLVCCGRRRGHG